MATAQMRCIARRSLATRASACAAAAPAIASARRATLGCAASMAARSATLARPCGHLQQEFAGNRIVYVCSSSQMACS
jgi:hypothetical protein